MLPILARTFFRIQERMLGRGTFAVLRDLERSQWWPRERIEALQLERLRRVVSEAYAQSRYWRSLMEARNIAPEDVRSLGDLRRFPLLEKESLRAAREEMVCRAGRRRLTLVRTSGSTNEALQFYTASDREAHINAARIRGHRWIGVDKGDKELYFWASPVELSKQDRLKRVRDFLVNDGLTNGLEITTEKVPQFVAQWRRWRPRCIFGYPSSFVLTALIARQAGVDLTCLKDAGVRVLCTTSEMLSPEDRRIITGAFDLPLYDSYGLREGGLVGHECEHHTMHTMDEQLILETIDPQTLQPTDGEGELVVTNVASAVTPILRYRTGDMVTLSDAPCPCGRSLRGISVSGGRLVDFIVTDQGKWVAGYSFIYICRPIPGIVKFQAQQDRIGEIRILLVTDANFPPDGEQRVLEGARARLASTDRIIVRRVPDIRPAASGKYRPVVSKVAEEMRASGRYDLGD